MPGSRSKLDVMLHWDVKPLSDLPLQVSSAI